MLSCLLPVLWKVEGFFPLLKNRRNRFAWQRDYSQVEEEVQLAFHQVVSTLTRPPGRCYEGRAAEALQAGSLGLGRHWWCAGTE